MVDRFDKSLQWVPPTRVIGPGVTLVRHEYSAKTRADLARVRRTLCDDGQQAIVTSDDSHWRFENGNTSVDASRQLVLPPDQNPLDAGHWIRTDALVHLSMPVNFQTPDGKKLLTMPANTRAEITRVFWEITDDWIDGGPPPAVGLSADAAPYDSKGSLLGGMTGSRGAELTAAIKYSALPEGPSFSDIVVLESETSIRFDRITSVFESGAGFVHVFCRPI